MNLATFVFQYIGFSLPGFYACGNNFPEITLLSTLNNFVIKIIRFKFVRKKKKLESDILLPLSHSAPSDFLITFS